MIRIERHISDLLLENDCISIPNMGGLVTQHFRAEINPGTHIVRPPSKRISFHEGLTANAHLLVTRISDAEKISLSKANDAIDALVKSWNLTLAEGDSIKLEGVGRFYQDKSGAICFNQSLEANFDLNAFGLDLFRATAIKRDTQIKQAVSTAIEENVSKKSGKAIPFWRAAAVFAGVGALLTIGFFKTDVSLEDSFAADFNPLHYSRTIEVPVASEKELPAATQVNVNEAISYEEAVRELPVEAATPEKALDELIIPASSVLPYQVIVGSFNEVSNAQDLILRLQRMNYEPQILKDNSSFYKVSIQGYAKRSEAAKALKNYKSQVNKGAWIYTVK